MKKRWIRRGIHVQFVVHVESREIDRILNYCETNIVYNEITNNKQKKRI